jgi:hypothetical protein
LRQAAAVADRLGNASRRRRRAAALGACHAAGGGDRRQALGLLAHHGAERRLARAGGDRRDGAAEDVLQPADRAGDAEVRHGVRPAVGGVLPARLAEVLLAVEHVVQVVGDLEGLADPCAQLVPRRRVVARRDGAHAGGGDEQRAGLGPVVGGEVDLRLALPGLSGADPAGHPRGSRQRQRQPGRAARLRLRCARQHLERHHDQRVARQHGQRLAKGAMHGRPPAPEVGIVEARQVVVHEARTVYQLDRRRCRVSDLRPIIAAGVRNRETEPRPHPRPARQDRMGHRRRQARRRAVVPYPPDRHREGRLDPVRKHHGGLRVCQMFWTSDM